MTDLKKRRFDANGKEVEEPALSQEAARSLAEKLVLPWGDAQVRSLLVDM